jgi:tetratricopeptide (TPR) repeat protein
MFNSKLKYNVLLLTAVAMFGTLPARSQSHNWNTQAREQAENANSHALSILSKGAAVKGGLDQAIAALLRATAADPTDPVPFTSLGLALDLKQRYGEALDALAKSYHLDAKPKETMLSIGITNYLARSYDKTEKELLTLLRQNPSFCDVHINLGFVYMRLGDFEKSKKQFKQAIVCNPNCEPAYQGMAIVDYLSGDLDSAYSEATHAETLKQYAPVTLLLAEICFLRGDQDQMRAALKNATKVKQPLEQRPMTLIGFSLNHDFHWDPYLTDDFDKASFVNARAVDLPEQEKKRKSLAASGKIEAELDRAKQALSLASNDFYLMRQVALLQMAAGDYGNAADGFNNAIKACPNDHIDHLYLGRALALAGKKVEGAECVSVYTSHFPQQKLAPAFQSIIAGAPADASTPPAQPALTPTKAPPSDAGF